MASSVLRLAAMLALSLPLAVFAADDSSFAQASAAFARGDYASALELFEAARAGGAEGPAVPFNIGVSEYKLGRYAEAEREFASLGERFPSMAGIAAYNRGLALLALDRRDDARAAFAAAYDSGDDKITALAAQQLAALGDVRPAPAARASASWTGLIDASLGNDDNVALVDELALPAGRSGDSSFTEVLAYASRSAGSAVPLRVDLSGYLVRYPDASDFDQTSFDVGAAYERRGERWRFEIGPHYDRSTLGGDDFEAELGVRARAQRPVGTRARFGFTLAFDDVSALDSLYDFVEGTQWRLGVFLRPSAAGLRASYDVERNDRVTPGASPDRQRATVGYRWRLGRSWWLDGGLSYRLSRYDFAADNRERLKELRVAASRDLARGWRVSADYRRSDNDADLPAYSYTGNRVAATLGKTF
ncbi:MAG TPA: tetratricopeptide repeat protein [Gammaproteobacteria bacterium]|nr:tetratricopeptide repeat protein [Gammaproteobacteria bacterium]